eukprot:TRINITY_DN11498_c0_g1_i1.p1 TRINITY_DN11498_c0_g1~~TRINITY_DN11498_c0_g1_i1.p1  ORF type:complete len:165 (+),score=28.75 TRINITY_DN11498_c0_g1_i1:104-598(+)
MACNNNQFHDPQFSDCRTTKRRTFVPKSKRNEQVYLEEENDDSFVPKPYVRKRKISEISEGPIATPLTIQESSERTLNIVRQKLTAGKPTKKQIHNSRDPKLLAKIKAPVFIATKESHGITPEQVQRAQQEHKNKLIGWKYHVLSKAQQEADLQHQRKKKRKKK